MTTAFQHGNESTKKLTPESVMIDIDIVITTMIATDGTNKSNMSNRFVHFVTSFYFYLLFTLLKMFI